jgi:methyl-accepting chemotaxis protein
LAADAPHYAALGSTVMAVVSQRSEKVRRYVEANAPPFDLLVDDSRDVVKAYGVWQRVGFDAWNIARPAVFVIDPSGVIRYVFVADWQTEFPARDDLIAALAQATPDPTR